MNINRYTFGKYEIWYLLDDDRNVSMLLLPTSSVNKIKEPWNIKPSDWNPASFMHNWKTGSLVYVNLAENNDIVLPGMTMKNFENKFKFKEQKSIKTEKSTVIITVLEDGSGCIIEHMLTHKQNADAFICESKFINNSSNLVTLEMISSFALDNLSPFCDDDGTGCYSLYRYYGGWSLEGKEIEVPLESLSLDRTWAGFSNNSERFGSLGSYPVDRYFPMAVIKDKVNNIYWAAQIAHNGSWQMEVSRNFDTISFTGGIGDNEFAQWSKKLDVGEEFLTPAAYISVSDIDIYDVCANLVSMQKEAWEQYGEQGLPICFNEFCTTWCNPTQENMISYCEYLKKYGIKYAVIDAGWSKGSTGQKGNGEWYVNEEIFPDMKQMCKYLRNNGIIPGIWFEFEVTTEGSKVYCDCYDNMHLKKNGKVIKHRNYRSYWDFRRQDVREYLKNHVIDFLKEYGFGYIKVDYNTNIGLFVDSEKGDGDGLREHLEYVKQFFIEMKKEIPDLIIENCASGGHRLEPTMIGVSAVSSFSDAHETDIIPCIAANLHKLMLPMQALIWSVLHNDEEIERTKYSLAATFLGRMCLSGDINSLREDQEDILIKAISFYNNIEEVLINGKSKEYGNRTIDLRKPQGTQIMTRYSDKECLIVCHSYNNPSDDIEIQMDGNYCISDDFYATNIKIKDGKLIIEKMRPFTAEAILLKKC